MFFIIINLLTICFCGQIDVLDYSVDYLNVGYTSKLELTFLLQNGLGKQGYLSLKIPFQLESSLSGTSALGVTLIYNEVSTSDCAAISEFPASLYKDSNGWYHVQFLNLDGDPKELDSNTYYQITITGQSSFSGQTSGIQVPIQAITIQDYTVNDWITYDFNRVLALLEFTNAPTATLISIITIESTTPTLLDYSYTILVSITPSIIIERKARIRIKMIDEDYLFQGEQCTSESYINSASETIDALNNTQYSCSISNNLLNINLYQIFNDTLQFSFTIKNPKFVKNNGGGFTIMSMYSYSNHIVEYITISNILSTSSLNWGTSNENLNTYFMFGLKLSDTTLPNSLTLIRGQNQNPYFNSLNFTFYPSDHTPLNLKLQITLNLNCDSGSMILEGSLNENLPQFDKNPVSCSCQTTNPMNIICSNVGQLTTNSIYYIAIKIYFPYQASPSTLPSDFGNIQIDSLNDEINIDAIPLIIYGRDQNAIYTTKNSIYIVSNLLSNGYTFAHSQQFTNTFACPTQSSYGLQYADYEQHLIFTSVPSISTFTPSSASNPAGYQLFTSPKIISGESTIEAHSPLEFSTPLSCSPSSGGLVATDFLFTDTTNVYIKNDNTQYTEIVLARLPSGTATIQKIFGGDASSNTYTVSIGPVYIQNNGTQYSNEDLIDFVGQSIQINGGAIQTLSSIIATNSYTLSGNNQMNNLYVSISNFWSGQSTNLDGTLFPAFIRVTGYLNQQIVDQSSKLVVFFSNLELFSIGTSNEGKTYVSCSSTMNTKQQCIGYIGASDTYQALQSVYHMHRIEFLLDDTFSTSGPASPFQLVIPVKTTINNNILQFIIATTSINTDSKIYSNFYSFKSKIIVQTLTSPSVSMNKNPSITLSASSYQLDYTNYQPNVGDKDSSAQIYYGHTDSSTVIQPNSGDLQGAAFFYQGTWNMVGSNFYTKALILQPGLTYQQQCVPYSYLQFYGILCPMIGDTIINSLTQYIKIEGFNYPNTGINTPTGGYGGWSDNKGNLQSFAADISNTISTGSITLSTTTKTTIQKGYQDQIINWIFTTTNSIPKDGYISITFITGSWPFTVSITKCYVQSSQVAIQIEHTCTLSKVDGSEIRFTLLASQEFPKDTYTIIQYGINMPDTSASDQSYSIGTYTSSGIKIDSTNIGAGTLTFNNSPLQPSIIIDTVQIEKVNIGMRGQFSFNFQLKNRGILYNQQLQIVLSMFSTTTISKTHCYILYQNGSTSFDWKSLSGTTFNSILLTPIDDLDAEIPYTFKCFNVITPSSYIAPQINMLSGSTILSTGTDTTSTLTFQSSPTTLSSSTITKYYSQPSTTISFVFNLIISDIFNSTTSVYINFPIYYNSYDNENSLSCQINTYNAFCQYYNERTIKIQLFTTTIDAQQQINLTLLGIIQTSSQGDTIFIMIDYDDTESTINEYITLNDPTTTSTIPSSFIIRDFDISTTSIRIESQYQYWIQNIGSISTGQYLLIDFPSSDYGKLIELKPPSSCQGILESDNSTLISKCQSLGNRLILLIDADISSKTDFTIIITGMTNMEASSCYIKLPTFSIVSTDNITIQQLSTTTYSNIQQFKLQQNSSYYTIYWKIEDQNQINYTIQSTDTLLRLNYNTIQLTPGIYSEIISLGVINQGFNKKMNFTISSNSGSFQMINELQSYPGDGKILTRIGCVQTTNPQDYYLYFTKTESDTTQYSEPGIIQVVMITTKTTVSTQYQNYNIPLLYKSIPVLIDFTDIIPVESLNIQLELIPYNSSDSPGLNFESSGTTTLSVDVTQDNLLILFNVISDTEITNITNDHYSTLTMTFSSGSYYQQSSTQTIFQLIEDNSDSQKSGITYTMTLNQLSSYSNWQQVIFQADYDLIIYYHISLINGIEREFDDVYNFVDNNTQLKYSDYNQEQFGILYYSSGISYTLLIKQLKARTWYKIKSWAVSIYNKTNNTDYVEFVTQNNNGRLLKLLFNFGTQLTYDNKKDLACWLCYSFAYPCYNLMSYDSIFCNDSINKNLSFNSTQLYSQYRRILTSDDTDESTNTTTDESTTDESTTDESTTTDESSDPSSIYYYFLPNQDLLIDDNWQQVIDGIADSNFLRYYVGNLTNTTQLISIDSLEEITFDKSPEITSTLKFIRGKTWLYIYNIRLRETGLVWGYITPKFYNSTYTTDGLIPTNIQIKYFANCLNQSIPLEYFFIEFYESDSISYNFTNLDQSRWYNIYIIATQDSPGLWTEISDVYSYTNKTLRESFTQPTAIIGIIVQFYFYYYILQ